MSQVTADRLQDTMAFLRERLQEGQPQDPVRLELLARGFEEKLDELYQHFQRGECSLGFMAERLGINTWVLYDLLEQRGLRTTNL